MIVPVTLAHERCATFLGSGMRFQNRGQEVAYCSRELKLLARELGIPVLAAAQLGRASEVRADHKP